MRLLWWLLWLQLLSNQSASARISGIRHLQPLHRRLVAVVVNGYARPDERPYIFRREVPIFFLPSRRRQDGARSEDVGQGGMAGVIDGEGAHEETSCDFFAGRCVFAFASACLRVCARVRRREGWEGGRGSKQILIIYTRHIRKKCRWNTIRRTRHSPLVTRRIL